MLYEPHFDIKIVNRIETLISDFGEPNTNYEALAGNLKLYGRQVVPYLFRAFRSPKPIERYSWSASQSISKSRYAILRLLAELINEDILSFDQLNEYRQIITAEKGKH